MRKRILTLLLAAFTMLFSVTVTACSVETRAPNGSFGVGDSGSGDEKPPQEDVPSDGAFKVVLEVPEGETLESVEGVYAVWTEKDGLNVYQAPFNEAGVATSSKPDGEYQVTLSKTPDGFTYNPNIYTASNTENETRISLIPLRELTGNGEPYQTPYTAATGGAYRFTFTKAGEEQYFLFKNPHEGTMHFKSLLDVTKDEVLPILYQCYHVTNADVQKQIVGGGEESSYTKNFYASYALTNSQEQLFKLGVETTNPSAYPIVVDVLIEITKYEDEYTNLTEIPVPDIKLPSNRRTTVGDSWVADMPRGNFVLLADVVSKTSTITFEADMVKKVYNEETQTYFYYLNETYWNEKYPGKVKSPEKKMLYARLAKDVPGIVSSKNAGGWPDTGISYRSEIFCTYPNAVGQNYTEFFKAYLAKMDLANEGPDFPVDEHLQKFLEDYSISHRIFFDGYGNAEGTIDSSHVYSATTDGRWLFVCGYYSLDTKG